MPRRVVGTGRRDGLSRGRSPTRRRAATSGGRKGNQEERARPERELGVTQAGARSGCSISASRKCKPPWCKGLFVAAPADYEERERCEEREMAACLEAAKEACIKFAKGKCIGPFRDARIASEGLLENTDFDVWGAAADKRTSTSSGAVNNEQSFSPVPGVTNYRGSDVLDSLSPNGNNSSG